jgi:hypothetical protein
MEVDRGRSWKVGREKRSETSPSVGERKWMGYFITSDVIGMINHFD